MFKEMAIFKMFSTIFRTVDKSAGLVEKLVDAGDNVATDVLERSEGFLDVSRIERGTDLKAAKAAAKQREAELAASTKS